MQTFAKTPYRTQMSNMVYCCVPFCKSKYEKGGRVSFHNFPKNNVIKKQWIHAISRQGTMPGTLWTPNNRSSICSNHFKDTDFSISTKSRILLPRSVPSIFPNYYDQERTNYTTRKLPMKRNFAETENTETSKRNCSNEELEKSERNNAIGPVEYQSSFKTESELEDELENEQKRDRFSDVSVKSEPQDRDMIPMIKDETEIERDYEVKMEAESGSSNQDGNKIEWVPQSKDMTPKHISIVKGEPGTEQEFELKMEAKLGSFNEEKIKVEKFEPDFEEQFESF